MSKGMCWAGGAPGRGGPPEEKALGIHTFGCKEAMEQLKTENHLLPMSKFSFLNRGL